MTLRMPLKQKSRSPDKCLMPLFRQHKESACHWGIWRMDESYEELCSLLPSALVAEAENRFSAPHRRQEWLSVRALLRELSAENHEIAYLPSGKPYLAGSSRHISISHTKGYVAVILGASNVGIDIEQYGHRVHKVASKYMCFDEHPQPYAGDDTWSLLLHWSAKEVLFKCLDAENVDFKEHLRVFPFVPSPQGTFHACEYKTEQHRSFQIHYLLHADFVLTWTFF